MACANSTLLFPQLNNSTCSLGSWLVKCTDSQIVECSYQWRGADVTTRKLMVTLLSLDASQYCLGLVKAANKKIQAG